MNFLSQTIIYQIFYDLIKKNTQKTITNDAYYFRLSFIFFHLASLMGSVWGIKNC